MQEPFFRNLGEQLAHVSISVEEARCSEDVWLSSEIHVGKDPSPKVDLTLPVLLGGGSSYTAQHPWLGSARSRPGVPGALDRGRI